MRFAVPGYVHARGIHCGSAAMRGMLAFRGIALSEPMCFGLGSGAGFLYVREHPVPPGVTIHGRTLEMERDLCDALGVPFPETPERDADAGWTRARAAVAAGNPVLVSTDLADLDYFGTKTHFGGHRIVLVGFDDEAATATVSDSEWDAPQTLPIESLKASRSSRVPPYPMENRWCVIAPERPPRSVAEAVPIALAKNARGMLDPAEGESAGVRGMRAAAADMPFWPEMTADWLFAARFAYQVIEKRGTGGGLFRRMYARYLQEASEDVPALARFGLPREMASLAELWSGIASLFKSLSESGDAARFREIAELFRWAADAEEAFWKRVAGEYR